MKELDLELKKNVLNLTSEKYYLRVDLPEEVDPVNQAKAKFHKEKKQLTVSARIVGWKKDIFIFFYLNFEFIFLYF